jgi:hypothetical protein
VHLSQQSVRERESLSGSGEPVLEGSDVVGDLDDVVGRHAGSFFELEQEKVREGRLGTLDLGGQHCLFSDVRIEKEVGVRKQRSDAVEPPEREQRSVEAVSDLGLDCERGIG